MLLRQYSDGGFFNFGFTHCSCTIAASSICHIVHASQPAPVSVKMQWRSGNVSNTPDALSWHTDLMMVAPTVTKLAIAPPGFRVCWGLVPKPAWNDNGMSTSQAASHTGFHMGMLKPSRDVSGTRPGRMPLAAHRLISAAAA